MKSCLGRWLLAEGSPLMLIRSLEGSRWEQEARERSPWSILMTE